MTLPPSHQGALEDALAYIMRSQQYKSTQVDSGIKADYEKIWLDSCNFILSKYGNFWASKTTTVTENEDLVDQFGHGWSRLPADWIRFEPDTFHGDVNQTDTGERIGKIAGETFTYVYLPNVIDHLPIEMREALKWRFLAQLGLRDAALIEKYPALLNKASKSLASLNGKVMIETQKRRNAGKGRGMWQNSFL